MCGFDHSFGLNMVPNLQSCLER